MFSVKNKTRNSQYISEQLQVHFHGTITTGCIQKTADLNLYSFSTLNDTLAKGWVPDFHETFYTLLF